METAVLGVMTQENKQLLLKDLCTRLPYNVKINIKDDYSQKMVDDILCAYHIGGISYNLESRNLRPYLRKMSSMTEEEQRTLDSMCNGVEMVSRLSGLKMFDKAFAWLLANHFDFRGLIEKGLALEAKEGMYK